jgi:hypothetical protein
MADKELIVQEGSLYMLEWRVPDTAVTNVFVNPDGTTQEFPDPNPAPAGETASKIEITVRKGPTEATVDRHHFRKNRTPPFMAKDTVTTPKGDKRKVKVFSAIFKAHEEGVYLFTVAGGPEGKSITQKMTVTPAKKVYRTIQEVMDDPKAIRRQAVLAAIADQFPSFNTWAADPSHGAGKTIGQDSGIVDQGPWVRSYEFDGKGGATSCTSVNPAIHGTPETKNDGKKWAFDAGPAIPPGNKAWVRCDKDNIPSVGDTYILLNAWKMQFYGHVGTILHVPPSGNGLWVTADGGQGSRPEQLGILVPRWGLMGAMLPLQGMPQGSYKSMKPEADAGPFLSGATAGDIHTKAPVPAQNDDVPGMIKRIQFRETFRPQDVACPRRIEGFVDLDSTKLTFDIDGQTATPAMLAKCKVLQGKVEKVIAACLRGVIVGGKGT